MYICLTQDSKWDGMKRYAIPGLPLAGTGMGIISWLALEWHVFFPNSSHGLTCTIVASNYRITLLYLYLLDQLALSISITDIFRNRYYRYFLYSNSNVSIIETFERYLNLPYSSAIVHVPAFSHGFRSTHPLSVHTARRSTHPHTDT